MATYYWVGGAGTWGSAATANWSLSSGGAGGAGIPTSTDNAIFDTSSGTGNISVNNSAVCNDLTITSTQALNIGTANLNLTLYGSLSISSGVYSLALIGTAVTFAATTTGKTISTGGTYTSAWRFNGVGGGWTILSNVDSSSAGLTLTNGTLNTNGYSLVFGAVVYSATGTFSLTLGTSNISSLRGVFAWNFPSTTGLTFSGASSTIVLENTFGTTLFAGGGLTYGSLVFGPGPAGSIFSLTGANTFTGTLSKTNTNAFTITLPSSVTTTVANWTVSGSSGKLATLNSSTAGTRATLSKSTAGFLSVDYLSVKDINGSPSNIWYVGRNSTDGGNNINVYFANAYSDNVSEATTLLDSTTQITPVSIIELITSIADTSSTVAAFSPSVAEDLVVYDASTTIASFVSSASEPTTLVDYLVGNGVYPINAVETLALNDVETSVKIHNASTEEPISVLYVTDRFGWGTIDNTESTDWVLIDNRQ